MHDTLQTGLVWFRRDLRLHDNPAVAAAARQCRQVHGVFVLDQTILDSLPRADRRVEFILQCLADLDTAIRQTTGSSHGGLIVLHGDPRQAIPALAAELGVHAVFCAHDYEPVALERDRKVQAALALRGTVWNTVQDHVLVEPTSLLNLTGQPYRVFTPYLRAWRKVLESLPAKQADPGLLPTWAHRPLPHQNPVPTLESLRFERTNLEALGIRGSAAAAQALLDDFAQRMDRYGDARDFPAIKGPSYMSVHLRFGTISIRRAARLALERSRQGSAGANVWLSELAWRDFYFQILAHFPHVTQRSFKPEYDAIEWECGEKAERLFEAWCKAQTGYPLVDAAMAQLNQTGYMHNRLRMVAGSFLVKHLGIDWRWGERYFAEKLNDFDLAANNGGWQWVSSSGCDAQPYFRIFNPVSQSEKFDPHGKFIRRYLPQLEPLDDRHIHAPWNTPKSALDRAGIELGRNYPFPIVDQTQGRNRTLLRYAVIRKDSQTSTA